VRWYESDRRQSEDWLPVIGTVVGFLLLVLIVRGQRNLQIRHIIAVWPVLMLPLVHAARDSTWYWLRLRQWFVPIAVLGLIAANVVVIAEFRDFYAAPKHTERDRDYRTFVHEWVKNQRRALTYLEQGSTLGYDVSRAHRARDWEEVIRLVEAESTPPSRGIDLWYSNSLYHAGREREALDRVQRLAATHPEARPLHVEIARNVRGPEVARELLRLYLPRSQGRVRDQLLRAQSLLEGAREQ
jgi:hypothetical protein